MSDRSFDIVIVGAGLSGLAAARSLGRDHRVLVVDKGRSVGGRLATRRIGGARLDHGAQFFTVRGDDFAATVAEAQAHDAVYEWCQGFGPQADGFPRYAGRSGMNHLAKWLASNNDAPIEVETEVDSLAVTDHGVALAQAGVVVATAPVAVLTAPVSQSLALCDAGQVSLDPVVDAALRQIDYFHTLALLATLDRPPAVDEPGGEQHSDGPFTFIADNQRKGVSEVPALTAHAAHDYSKRRYDDDPGDVLAELLKLADPWLGPARVIEAQLKKWRYAGPVEPIAERTLISEHHNGRILFAGDAFGGPKVEGAFNSGRAAAEAAQS